MEDIKEYLSSRTAADVNLRCYQWLIGFCAANPRRFDSEDQSNGEVWGKYEDGYVYINKTVFDELLKNKSFSPGAFLDWACRKDLLRRQYYGPGNKNNKMTVQVRKGGKNVPHVAIKLPSDEQEPVPAGYSAVDPGEDMPF